MSKPFAEYDGLSVYIASDDDHSLWDTYVENHAEGTFFHKFGWRNVISKVYGYESYFLFTRNDKNIITGALPLIYVKSPLFGRSLISTAFTVGGGCLADDVNAETALVHTARSIGERDQVKYVEIRGGHLVDGALLKKGVYAGFEKEIPEDPQENLLMVRKKKRADLRKGLAFAEEGTLRWEISDDFKTAYDVYAQNVRGLGTPIWPRKWLTELMNEFGKDVELGFVKTGNETVSVLISFYFKNKVLPYYTGSLDSARKLYANDFMYYACMRRAIERGANIFDFGRSKYGTGPFNYKTYWGFEPEPLNYQYLLIGASEMPNVNPQNPKFALMSKIWKKLPLPIANTVGPLLARNLA